MQRHISCYQWFTNGDHPQDHSPTVDLGEGYANYFEYKASPGAVVARYDDSLAVTALPSSCPSCGKPGHSHGLIRKLSTAVPKASAIVCPGNYVAEDDTGYFSLALARK